MASGAAGDGIYGNLFGGSISTDDIGVRRRPYHRNCTCALHNSGENHCSHVPLHKVSYPIRRSWSEGSLVAMVAAAAPSSGAAAAPSSGGSSPAPAAPAPARLPPRGSNRQLNR